MREGGVSSSDWLHVVVALCFHDIGYVRGVCRQDNDDICATGVGDAAIALPTGATDAALTPYHVDRSQCVIREHFSDHEQLNVDRLATYIERTRFPVPDAVDYQMTADYAGLVRAADLIGQLADPRYLSKLPALFYEFEQTGTNTHRGYNTPDDLRRDSPAFFWQVAYAYIKDGLHHLQVTEEGQSWLELLYGNVFAVEHLQIGSLVRRETAPRIGFQLDANCYMGQSCNGP